MLINQFVLDLGRILVALGVPVPSSPPSAQVALITENKSVLQTFYLKNSPVGAKIKGSVNVIALKKTSQDETRSWLQKAAPAFTLDLTLLIKT